MRRQEFLRLCKDKINTIKSPISYDLATFLQSFPVILTSTVDLKFGETLSLVESTCKEF